MADDKLSVKSATLDDIASKKGSQIQLDVEDVAAAKESGFITIGSKAIPSKLFLIVVGCAAGAVTVGVVIGVAVALSGDDSGTFDLCLDYLLHYETLLFNFDAI